LEVFRTCDWNKADEITSILPGAAILMAKANLSANSACTGNLRSLLVNASDRLASPTGNPHSGENELGTEATNRTIPYFTMVLMTTALVVVYQER
jgi:hypothetical protein